MSKTNGKTTDYFVLVNEDNKLPDGFEDTVELVMAGNVAGNHLTASIRKKEVLHP